MNLRPQPAWRNPQILLTLSLVFLCGALAGAVVYKVVSQPVTAGGFKPGANKQTLNNLKRELNLTPEQAAEIETVLDDFSLYYQMLNVQMDETMTISKQRIDQCLTEEQRKRFSRIMNELKEQKAR